MTDNIYLINLLYASSAAVHAVFKKSSSPLNLTFPHPPILLCITCTLTVKVWVLQNVCDTSNTSSLKKLPFYFNMQIWHPDNCYDHYYDKIISKTLNSTYRI